MVKSFLAVAIFMFGCAGSSTKKDRPYKVRTFEKDFDFSKLKQGSTFYIYHNNGVYYEGGVDLHKSGPGYLCLYQGQGTKCFKQNNIKEITEGKAKGGFLKSLAINLLIVAVFVGLFYLLPSP